MLVTGFPYNVHQKADEFLKVFGQVLKQARAVRRLGSAAIDICWVAAGRMDGFWEASLKPWDTRAAALILEEAGGTVTGMDGKTVESRTTATSSPPTVSFTTRCCEFIRER